MGPVLFLKGEGFLESFFLGRWMTSLGGRYHYQESGRYIKNRRKAGDEALVTERTNGAADDWGRHCDIRREEKKKKSEFAA